LGGAGNLARVIDFREAVYLRVTRDFYTRRSVRSIGYPTAAVVVAVREYLAVPILEVVFRGPTLADY
jgi:hypothetical protein